MDFLKTYDFCKPRGFHQIARELQGILQNIMGKSQKIIKQTINEKKQESYFWVFFQKNRRFYFLACLDCHNAGKCPPSKKVPIYVLGIYT